MSNAWVLVQAGDDRRLGDVDDRLQRVHLGDGQLELAAADRGDHRLDYAGGTKGGAFFMKNGGFFDERVKFDQWFEKPSNPKTKPAINFKDLPKGEVIGK